MNEFHVSSSAGSWCNSSLSLHSEVDYIQIISTRHFMQSGMSVVHLPNNINFSSQPLLSRSNTSGIKYEISIFYTIGSAKDVWNAKNIYEVVASALERGRLLDKRYLHVLFLASKSFLIL